MERELLLMAYKTEEIQYLGSKVMIIRVWSDRLNLLKSSRARRANSVGISASPTRFEWEISGEFLKCSTGRFY